MLANKILAFFSRTLISISALLLILIFLFSLSGCSTSGIKDGEQWYFKSGIGHRYLYDLEYSKRGKPMVSAKIEMKGIEQGDDNNLVEVSTIKKEGKGSLHLMGLPEQGETIRFRVGRDGRIIHVEDYPKDSKFYVSSLVLPEGSPEQVKEWEHSGSWKGKDGRLYDYITNYTLGEGTQYAGENCTIINAGLELSSDFERSGGGSFNGKICFSKKLGAIINLLWEYCTKSGCLNKLELSFVERTRDVP